VTQNVVRSGLRLSQALNHDLTEIAKEIGMRKNQLIIKILWDWVQEQKEKEVRA